MSIINQIIYQQEKRNRAFLFGIIFVLLTSNVSMFGQTPTSTSHEYQIKAAFLFNFTQFIEWPANTFSSTKAPIIIGVLGKNPFGTHLTEIITGEEINGHPLQVQYYNNIDDLKNCNILFIPSAEAAKLDQIITGLGGRNILTVSDAPNFIRRGGMIRFLNVNNKIHFQINPEAVKEAHLVISSKLLRLAEIVVPNKNN
jgi:hypothetical protein